MASTVSLHRNPSTPWRTQQIEELKKLFVAFTSRDGTTGTAMVAAVLFDAAAKGKSAADGLEREELIEAVNNRLTADGKPDSYSATRLSTDLDRVTGSIAEFAMEYPHLPRVIGPTRNQRGDKIKRLWLDIKLGPEPERGPCVDPGITGDPQPTPAALTPIFSWLRDRYRRLAPERRAAVDEHSKTGTVVGFVCAVAILLAGCFPQVRQWLWVHFFLTPKLAGVDASVSGMCLDGRPFATVTFRNIPDVAPLVILRNDKVVQRIERISNDRIDYKDTTAEGNARYVYRLATVQRGHYIVSGAAMAIIPTCVANNHPPVADNVQVSASNGDAPLAVTFSVTAHDLDHDALRYYWTFGDGDGLTTTTPTVTHVFRYAGTWTVGATIVDARGGETWIGDRVPDVHVPHGPLPPLLTNAEIARRFGFGEGSPDAAPLGTTFRFRVFPRRSSRGAQPVGYRWTHDKCRQSAIVAQATHTVAPDMLCASDELTLPVYQARIPAEGQYTYSVDIRYADGQVEHLPIAVVNVGYKEHVFRMKGGTIGNSIERVPPGGDYTPWREELAVPSSPPAPRRHRS